MEAGDASSLVGSGLFSILFAKGNEERAIGSAKLFTRVAGISIISPLFILAWTKEG